MLHESALRHVLIGVLAPMTAVTAALGLTALGSEQRSKDERPASGRLSVGAMSNAQDLQQRITVDPSGVAARERDVADVMTAIDVDRYLTAVAVDAYLTALAETQRQVDAYLAARARASAPAPRVSTGPSIALECGNTVLPAYIVQRESGGQCNAYNPTGCSGHGCIGYAQLDQAHFWPGGTCYGLTYNACVSKLWAGGAGASNWG